MVGLGIEGTAHTFSVGIVTSEGKILASIESIYQPEIGGIHPREAAQHHVRVAEKVIERALEEAKISLDDIEFVAFSQGPGLKLCQKFAERSLS